MRLFSRVICSAPLALLFALCAGCGAAADGVPALPESDSASAADVAADVGGDSSPLLRSAPAITVPGVTDVATSPGAPATAESLLTSAGTSGIDPVAAREDPRTDAPLTR